MNSTIIEGIQIEVKRDELESYEVDINLVWTSDPGVYTYRNGDPGYPPSFEYDFQVIHAYLIDENGKKEEVSSERFDELYSDISEYLDNIEDLEEKLENGEL